MDAKTAGQTTVTPVNENFLYLNMSLVLSLFLLHSLYPANSSWPYCCIPLVALELQNGWESQELNASVWIHCRKLIFPQFYLILCRNWAHNSLYFLPSLFSPQRNIYLGLMASVEELAEGFNDHKSLRQSHSRYGNWLPCKKQKHTTVRIRWWSLTQLLTHRRVAYVRSIASKLT